MANLTEENTSGSAAEKVEKIEKKVVDEIVESTNMEANEETTEALIDEREIGKTEETTEPTPVEIQATTTTIPEPIVTEKTEEPVETEKTEETVETEKTEEPIETEKTEEPAEEVAGEPIEATTETSEAVNPIEAAVDEGEKPAEVIPEPAKRGRGAKKAVAKVEEAPKPRAGKRKAAEVEKEPESEVVEPVVETAKAKRGRAKQEATPTKVVVVEEAAKPAKLIKLSKKSGGEEEEAAAEESRVALFDAPLVIEGKRTRRSVQTLDLVAPAKVVGEAKASRERAPAKKAGVAKRGPRGRKPAKSAELVEDEGEEEEEEEEAEETEEMEAEETPKEPTEADLRKTIEEIIGKANLDKVTMKTVVKDVHDKYPDSDLTGKKDFIKKVVKELLSS